MGQQLCGVCGNDLFEELSQKYGADFSKFMVAQKSKDVIGQQFGKLKGESNKIFQQFHNKSDGIVQQKVGTLDKLFGQIKEKVNQTVPGGISALQKFKGQDIQQFSGYNGLKKEFDGVKKVAYDRIEQEKVSLQGQMSKSEQDMVTKIDQERPKVPLYQDLPRPAQMMVRAKAEQVFAQQLKNNEQQIISSIANQYNLGSIQQLFGKVSPQGQAGSILGKAESILSGVLGMGSGLGGLLNGDGKGSSGGISGLIQGARGLFR